MRKFMQTIAVASLVAPILLGPSLAEAVCTQVIYAERAVGQTAVQFQIFGRNSSTDNFMWFATTTSPNFISLINAAVSNRNRVLVTGIIGGNPATTCPTVGSSRNIGTINNIVLSP